MKTSRYILWLNQLGIILLGLIIGYFLQPKSLEKYVGSSINGSNLILADGQRIEYIDVDADGNSEEFMYFHLSDSRKPVINQNSDTDSSKKVWYLDGEVAENFDFIWGDYNNDKTIETFVFSYYQNTLYLYGLSPKKNMQFIFDKKPIHQFDGNVDYSSISIRAGGVADLNNDGFGEVIFSVNSRFTQTPQRIYAYDIANDTLLKSAELGLQLVGQPIIFDINNDKQPEIFLSTLNNTNQTWNHPKMHAQNSACIVLKSDLTYHLEPNLFEGRFSVSSTFPLITDSENFIVCLNRSVKKDGMARLMLLNTKGEEIKKNRLPDTDIVFDSKRDDYSKILMFTRKGLVLEYNRNLSPVKHVRFKNQVNQIAYLDIDNDKTQEILVVQNNLLTIYRNDFTSPVSIEIPGLNIQKTYFSVKKNTLTGNQLAIQNSNQQYLISYSKNKFYWMHYLIYIASVLVVYLFFLVKRKVTARQIAKIKESNEKFYLMQMELIRSQLDPHFLFNALNSISYSINIDERKTAYNNLGLFSKFLRESIITLDDFSRTLDEEIDYVKNYLTLEKFRFKEKFEYDFIISPSVNKSQMVPKLILFSFIESALKKSVLPSEKGGRIDIMVDNYKGMGIYVAITDTGLHRNMGISDDSHTKNMLMMKRIVGYFNNFNQIKIEITLKDTGTTENPKGSTVEIIIPFDYNYEV